jgi:predicted nucleic acid-binding protein
VRIVLDTNVFISGVFFSGPPSQILKAWRDGEVQLLVSSSIIVDELMGECVNEVLLYRVTMTGENKICLFT